MIKSKFIRLYQSLSKAELRQLKLWVSSAMHNQHKDTLKLFNFLASRRVISGISIQKKRAFSYIFPNSPYEEKKLRYVMTYALKILIDFIGYNHALLNNFNYKKNITQELRRRNMLRIATIELEKLSEQVANSPLKNAQTSLQYFELECEWFNLEDIQTNKTQTNLPPIFKHLTDFYCLSMLKYACILSSQNNVTKETYATPILKVILPIIKNQNHPIIQLYQYLYKSLDEKTDSHLYLEKAENLFSSNYLLLNTQEQYEVLLLIINYCIKKRLNIDADIFIKKGFDWYKWGLEQEVLIKDGILSRFAYMNIVGMGLKLKEFDWVANFISQYAVYLPAQFQENYQHYATAKLLFKQKKYAQTQRLLIQIEYDYIFLNLDAKTTLLEIYYEEKSWDTLEALLVSFSRYLQRKKVIAYHKKVYKNIISLTRKLMSLKPYDKAAKKALLEEIKTTNPLAERDWLLKQIELL
jgi:hypothetical protein